MSLPEIHIIERNGRSIGLCIERPFLLRMSAAAREILLTCRTEDMHGRINLEPLVQKYGEPDILEALGELIKLEKKSHEKNDLCQRISMHPRVLSCEILSGSAQELDTIKKSIRFLLQGLETGENGTLILDHHCPASFSFCKTVWKFGSVIAKEHDKEVKIVLKTPLLSLNQDTVSIAHSLPFGIILVTTNDYSSSDLPSSVKTQLDRLVLETHPVGLAGQADSHETVSPLQSLVRVGISIVHESAGACAFSRHDPAFFAASESLKYISSLTMSLPSQYHCGAGRWYWAVSTNGKIYPCHRFIRDERFVAGHITTPLLDSRVRTQFENVQVTKKAGCQQCWARHLCGGGCAHEIVTHGEPLSGIHAPACENIKHNIEQAASVFADMDDVSKTSAGKLIHTLTMTLPYWQDSPRENTGMATLNSIGNSMSPLISDGAELTLQYTHPKDLRRGDIFSYVKGGKIITHRIMMKQIRNGKYSFMEKGDNVFFSGPIHNDVLGKVILLKNPGMKKPLRLDTPLWKFGNTLIVIIVMTLWLSYYIPRKISESLLRIGKQIRTGMKISPSPESRSLLSYKSERLLTVTNRITGSITRYLLFIHSQRNHDGDR